MYELQLLLLLAAQCRAGSNIISCHSSWTGSNQVPLPPSTPLSTSRFISCCKLIKITGANTRDQVLEYLLVCLHCECLCGAIFCCKFSINRKLHKMANEYAKSHSIPCHFVWADCKTVRTSLQSVCSLLALRSSSTSPFSSLCSSGWQINQMLCE